jgi:hypothetical protein
MIHRLSDIEHDPAGARREQPVAQRLHQAAALDVPARAEPPIEGRQIDHDAKRIGQSKRAIGRQLGQLQHETSLVGVNPDSHVRYTRLRERQRAAQDQGGEGDKNACHHLIQTTKSSTSSTNTCANYYICPQWVRHPVIL